MDSAGKRHNTEGTARSKHKLEEQDKSEAESSKKPKLDDYDSDLTSLDSAEIEELRKSIEDSPEPQPTQPVPTQSPAPSPAPGASQPTPMGPPRNPLSPPPLTHSPGTPEEHYLPDGEGIPVEDNDAWIMD